MSTATSKKPAFSEKLTSEEVDDLFDLLNGTVTFRRFEDASGGGLRVNPMAPLSPATKQFPAKNVKEAERLVGLAKLRVASAPNGAWVLASMEGEPLEKTGLKSNPCEWYWKLKTYYWGGASD